MNRWQSLHAEQAAGDQPGAVCSIRALNRGLAAVFVAAAIGTVGCGNNETRVTRPDNPAPPPGVEAVTSDEPLSATAE